jgi:hypothetical protein
MLADVDPWLAPLRSPAQGEPKRQAWSRIPPKSGVPFPPAEMAWIGRFLGRAGGSGGFPSVPHLSTRTRQVAARCPPAVGVTASFSRMG